MNGLHTPPPLTPPSSVARGARQNGKCNMQSSRRHNVQTHELTLIQLGGKYSRVGLFDTSVFVFRPLREQDHVKKVQTQGTFSGDPLTPTPTSTHC